ncbi:hypothetical protein J1614_010964 [Plenodomus biglobosus]|nr:hypothetical protein J1614_010964 [Plenodomus biglobosus]
MSTAGSVFSCAGGPQLMGIVPSNCGSCDSADAPQYKLYCHAGSKLYCRNCLTKTWYASNDEMFRCPHLPCHKVCGFQPLRPLCQTLHLDRSFYEIECIEDIRNQPEVMNNLIGFTRDEAIITLQQIYGMFEDQIMDPVALGGVPGHITADARDSFAANVSLNPFYKSLLNELTSVPKMMTTPLELEEDLGVALTRLLYVYARRHHETESAMWGVSLADQEAVVEAAVAKHSFFRDLKDNWTDIIHNWVELLTWCYLKRTAAPEEGSS